MCRLCSCRPFWSSTVCSHVCFCPIFGFWHHFDKNSSAERPSKKCSSHGSFPQAFPLNSFSQGGATLSSSSFFTARAERWTCLEQIALKLRFNFDRTQTCWGSFAIKKCQTCVLENNVFESIVCAITYHLEKTSTTFDEKKPFSLSP